MDHVGAMRIDDALGLAGGAGGVAHACGVVFVDLAPCEIVVGRQPFLVGLRVERRVGHVRRVGQDDDVLHGLEMVAQLLHQRHEGQVDEEQARFRVVHDPGDLLGEEARIDGVVDAARAHQPVPDLEMPPGVPGERRAAVAIGEAHGVELLGNAQRPRADFLVVGAVDRPLDRARHHLPPAMIDRRMVQELVAKQRPVLHQSQHLIPSSAAFAPLSRSDARKFRALWLAPSAPHRFLPAGAGGARALPRYRKGNLIPLNRLPPPRCVGPA